MWVVMSVAEMIAEESCGLALLSATLAVVSSIVALLFIPRVLVSLINSQEGSIEPLELSFKTQMS